MRNATTVPLFGLYGESNLAPEPGFVHIEDVADRSRALDWRIDPHRHANLFQVLCIFEGFADVELDASRTQLGPNGVLTVPTGVIHAFRFDPGTEGAVLTIAETVMRETAGGTCLAPLMTAPQRIDFDRENALFRQICGHLNLIAHELRQPGIGHALMLGSLVRIVLTGLVRRLEEEQLHDGKFHSDSGLLRGFQRLLEENFARQWPVQRYAAALNTSVSSLSRRCRHYVGMTPKAIIRNRVLVEAKRKLIYTREPVEHVAYSLGFRDPAYFSRFFRKSEGMAPGEYRKSSRDFV